jgi:prepilin-type N-terminal cleavage/methylation domain-containing protein
MTKRGAFTLIELLVVIAIIALLMAILMPALAKVRDQARSIGCIANLRQWNFVFSNYVNDNDGKFFSGCSNLGYWWPLQLDEKVQNWKVNKTWFCPTANTPIWDEAGVRKQSLHITDAWGIERPSTTGAPASLNYNGTTYTMNPHGVNGSYGLNGYMFTIPKTGTFEGGLAASEGYGNVYNAPNPGEVPVMLDGLRFDFWPQAQHAPAMNEYDFWTSGAAHNMARVCINRHRGFTNSSFLDWSVRKIGLKELWKLKWHRSFDTAGPWTKAGGVQASNWPDWLRNFKDY